MPDHTKFFLKRSSQQGMSLLGVLLATMILSGGVLSLAGLVASAQADAGVARERFIATNLAREAMELVRAQRDNNWFALNSPQVSSFEPVASWMTNLCDDLEVGEHTISIEPDQNVGIYITHSPEVAETSLFLSDDGRYTHLSSDASATAFSRVVTLDCSNSQQAEPLVNPVYVDVLTSVTWTSRGADRQVQLKSRLYDWYLPGTSCGGGVSTDGDGQDNDVGDVIGIYRPETHQFYLDTNGNFRADDTYFTLGEEDGIPIVGDWNGDGVDEAGVYRGATFFLDGNGDGEINDPDYEFDFGAPGDVPLAGNWDGNVGDEIGTYRSSASESIFYLDFNANGSLDATQDRQFSFGSPLIDKPIIGDWDGDGFDQIGVYRRDQFYLDEDGNGQFDPEDIQFQFGAEDGFDLPLAGDWRNEGRDAVGVYRPSTSQFFLDDNYNFDFEDCVDKIAPFGTGGDLPITGNFL